jgi:hypothetical protein
MFRGIFRKAAQSQIDWPMVGLAGAMAIVLVLSTTLMTWVASRSVRSQASGFRIGVAGPSGGATQSVADVRSHGERGNEEMKNAERGEEGLVERQQVASYPESDEQMFGSGTARSAGYASVPASPSRPESKGQAENDVQPARAGSCEQGGSEKSIQVAFAKDPIEAAELAKKEHKLMLVLHVSGNFEESKFT